VKVKCEYTEETVADSQQGASFQLRSCERGYQLIGLKLTWYGILPRSSDLDRFFRTT